MDRRQLQMYNRLLNHKEKLNYFIKNGTDDLKGNNQNYSNKVIKIIKKKNKRIQRSRNMVTVLIMCKHVDYSPRTAEKSDILFRKSITSTVLNRDMTQSMLSV